MPTYSLNQRSITFTSPVGEDLLLPESLHGVEGISQLFDFQLDLLAEAGAAFKPQSLIGQKVTVGLTIPGVSGPRYLNGLVASLSRGAGDDHFDTYTARIVPALWLLTLNSNCRIFQNKSVLDILKAVFQQYGLGLRVDAQGTYSPLDYCTQYHETDFHFVSRLMEQNGLFYFFAHTAEDHTLVLADGRNSYAACPHNATLQYTPPNATTTRTAADNLLHDLRQESTMVAGKHTRWDYDFRTFSSIKTESVDSSSPFGKESANERYDYPGAGAGFNAASGSPASTDSAQIKVSAVAEDISSDVFHGASNSPALTPGYTCDITKHTNSAWNRKFLLRQVTHTAHQSPSYRSGQRTPTADYANSFLAVVSDLIYRSPQATPKPVIPGPQTGVVVGSSGDEIYVDKFGRIKVQFFWDRLGKNDDTSSAWLRVAQQWAGKAWGTFFWPRIGDEVIIAFLDGDPDHPIVTGSVYNGVNTPPYPLPDNSTRSGVLTRSSKSGSAGNELRFEDKTGSEEIYLHAQKDQNLKIENNLGVTIGNDSATIITNNEHHHVKVNQMTAVDGDMHETIGGAHIEKITGAESRSLSAGLDETISGAYNLSSQNHSHTVGQVFVVDSGQEVHIKGGMKVVIESSMELCLTGPGGFISIGPAGIAISGMLVMINSGGAQVQGSPATAPSPKSATAPTDPTAPTGAGGGSGSSSSSSSSGASSSSSSGGGSGGSGSSPLGGVSSAIASAASTAAGAAASLASQAQSVVNQVQSAAQAAVAQVQSAVSAAEATAQAAVSQAQQALQQAQNAAAQAAQAAQQAAQQGSQFAQQTAAQAQAAAAQAQQQAQQALAQAQQAAQQAQQQAQQAITDAKQAAQQAEQQAQQAAQNAENQGQQAVQQLQQQAQQAAAQAQAQVQQAAAQAQQAAQAAAKQAQAAAAQAQQAAQGAQTAAKNALNAVKNPF